MNLVLLSCSETPEVSTRTPASAELAVGTGLNAKSANSYIERDLSPIKSFRLSNEKADQAKSKVNSVYQFLLGKLFSHAGRSDEASRAFERGQEFDETSSELHLSLSQEYLKKGWISEGIALLRKSIALNPKNKEAKSLLANMLSSAKKYGEAYVLLEEVVAEDPEDEESKLLLVLLDIELKNPKKAEARLHKMTVDNPDSALAYFYLGRLAQEQDKNQEALTYYKKAIELRAGFVQAGTYLGALQEGLGDKEGALDTYTWLAGQTDSASFHRKLGQLQLERSEYEKALESFENFERLEPGDMSNKIRLGLLYMQLKKTDLAVKMFQEALKKNPDGDGLRLYLANIYEQAGHLPQALFEYEKITSKDKKFYGEALKRRLYILGKLNPLKAEEIWLLEKSKAETSSEWFEDLFLAGALMYEVQKKYTQALTILDEGKKHFPGSESYLYIQGMLYEKAGDWKKAVGQMERLLALNPYHTSALNFVGYIWAERGIELNRAEKMIRKALKQRPDDGLIQDSLGWVLFKKKKYQEAKEILKKAHGREPRESIIAEHLADTLVKLGEFDEAKRLYELALKLGPENNEISEHLGQKLSALKDGKPLDPCEAKTQVARRFPYPRVCDTARVHEPATRTPTSAPQN